jgi:hypothetical protein
MLLKVSCHHPAAGAISADAARLGEYDDRRSSRGKREIAADSLAAKRDLYILFVFHVENSFYKDKTGCEQKP